MIIGPRQVFGRLALIAVVASVATVARAGDISSVSMFRNVAHIQTGNGPTISESGAFFSAELKSVVAGDYTSVDLTYPPLSTTVPLTNQPAGADFWRYQTAGFVNQAAMDTEFGFGTYDYSATDGSDLDTTSLVYSEDRYALTPFLTGTDYSDLQGLNAANAFTFHLSPFGSDLGTFPLIFLTVFDFNLGMFVFNAVFLPPTTTSIVMAGGTLAAGHTFSFEVDYSNRFSQMTDNTVFPGFIGYDARTTGTFSTAPLAVVPEPGSLAMVSLGCVLGVLVARKRRV
jgi:PEP-CTERM motif